MLLLDDLVLDSFFRQVEKFHKWEQMQRDCQLLRKRDSMKRRSSPERWMSFTRHSFLSLSFSRMWALLHCALQTLLTNFSLVANYSGTFTWNCKLALFAILTYTLIFALLVLVWPTVDLSSFLLNVLRMSFGHFFVHLYIYLNMLFRDVASSKKTLPYFPNNGGDGKGRLTKMPLIQ